MTEEKIPLTVLSGFLGSGKTTLLNHLLATTSGRRIAVLVNDFGPINIDARLVASHDGQTISLANGCICCSIGSGLDAALIDVLARDPRPDWIVIEASGISHPGPIADVGLTEPLLRLAGVATVLDAEHIEEHYNDPLLHDTVARQIRDADLLILNKIDLLDKTQLQGCRQFLATQFPGMAVVETINAQIAESVLADMDHHDAHQRQVHDDEDADHPFVSIAWRSSGVLSADRIMATWRELPRTVVRAKGVVRTDYHGWTIVHYAGRRVQFQALNTHMEGDNELVYIGLPESMDADHLKQISDACLTDASQVKADIVT